MASSSLKRGFSLKPFFFFHFKYGHSSTALSSASTFQLTLNLAISPLNAFSTTCKAPFGEKPLFSTGVMSHPLLFNPAETVQMSRMPTSFCTTKSSFQTFKSYLHTACVEEVEGPKSFVHKINARGYEFLGDLSYEGTGAGPDPKDFALSAVALCTSMTIRLYANRKNWPLEKIRVEIFEQGEGKEGHTPKGLQLKVYIEGSSLTPAQKQSLIQIAEQCPVKKMMSGKMVNGISTTLAD